MYIASYNQQIKCPVLFWETIYKIPDVSEFSDVVHFDKEHIEVSSLELVQVSLGRL